ncbi:MAG: diadenylate cyclase, partial [Erysipelothrix sp.]|nr:diadenylate cyclase [Erysipelothrix sp.]
MPLTLFTFQFILRALQIIIDFVILWIVIYYVLRIVRNNSRTVQIFKGIILVIALWYVASVMKLLTTKALLDYVIQYAFLVVIIIFQPEIRGMLERLGQTSVFSALHSLSGNEKEQLVDELVEATVDLSKRRVGALISIEQGHSLSDYVKTGTPINSSVTSELLSSIFVTSTPLHDGAVIIQGDRIACASAYFPPTNIDLPTSYGARHR